MGTLLGFGGSSRSSGPSSEQLAAQRAAEQRTLRAQEQAAAEQRALLEQQRAQIEKEQAELAERSRRETQARSRRLRGFAALTSAGFRGFALGERETLG